MSATFSILSSADSATWVQAICTIFLVGITIWYARTTSQMLKEMRFERQHRRENAIEALLIELQENKQAIDSLSANSNSPSELPTDLWRTFKTEFTALKSETLQEINKAYTAIGTCNGRYQIWSVQTQGAGIHIDALEWVSQIKATTPSVTEAVEALKAECSERKIGKMTH